MYRNGTFVQTLFRLDVHGNNNQKIFVRAFEVKRDVSQRSRIKAPAASPIVGVTLTYNLPSKDLFMSK
jgi:hypothetical protein